MVYAYNYSNVLQKFEYDIFSSLLAIKLPTSMSDLFFRKTHKTHILKKINERVIKLSSEEREELINEFLLLLPMEESVEEYNEFYRQLKESEFKEYNKYFSDFEKEYKNLRPSARKQVLWEALKQIEAQIVKIKTMASSYALESKNIEPYLITDQLLDVCLGIIHSAKDILKKKKVGKELDYLMGLIFFSLLNLEAVRRGKRRIDYLYGSLSLMSVLVEEDLTKNQELNREMYEVLSLS